MKKIKWKDISPERMENLKESLLKSITYRIITIFLGMLVVYIITGSLAAALSLGLITESIWLNFHS